MDIEIVIASCMFGVAGGLGYAVGWFTRRHIAYETHLDALTEVKVVHS